jgi:hypothetical protein
MAKLTVYKSEACGACKRIVPIIRRNARARGDKVTVKDIDKCSSKECEKLGYVPAIYRDGKELKDSELEAYLK